MAKNNATIKYLSPRILEAFLDGSKSSMIHMPSSDYPVFEQKSFAAEVPYRIEIQHMYLYNRMHLHYADSLEILLIQKLKGHVIVGGKKLLLDDAPHVLIFMPGVLHTGRFDATDPVTHTGLVYCLQFSLDELAKTVSVGTIMSLFGRKISDLGNSKPEYDSLMRLVLNLIQNDSDAWKRAQICVEIFELLAKSLPNNGEKEIETALNEPNVQLNNLINWTRAHIGDKVSVGDAAEFMHMSRYYFCHYFKKQTGITYLQFLNQLRYRLTVQMLQAGFSTTECCLECGFGSLSYFTQWFKRISGRTTSDMRRDE